MAAGSATCLTALFTLLFTDALLCFDELECDVVIAPASAKARGGQVLHILTCQDRPSNSYFTIVTSNVRTALYGASRAARAVKSAPRGELAASGVCLTGTRGVRFGV